MHHCFSTGIAESQKDYQKVMICLKSVGNEFYTKQGLGMSLEPVAIATDSFRLICHTTIGHR